MHLITSHLNTDFDSLASMVAIQKLYPDAVICPPGSMDRKVRDFLSHYGHQWTIWKPKKVPQDQVTLMVVVDARARGRIGTFAALVGRQDVKVHVFDHHPPTMDDIPADRMCYAPVGAVTTMIVEELIKERKSISPEEATLFALGIYDDTGALTYEATTERDIRVLGRLRDMGAEMSRILSRTESSMSAGDLRLLDALAENARESYVNGAKVLLTWATTEEYVEGLALLIHRLKDYYDSQVTIAVVDNGGKKTNVIARSAPDVLNVKEFLAPWGGGGHVQAGSATVLGRDAQELLGELEAALPDAIPHLVDVASVMTSPVLAVSPDALVDEAYRTMLRYGHQSLPVAGPEGEVLGIMTRKDLDKAHLHGFDRARIRDFMTEGVIGISSVASLDEAHRLMATYGFERLPVMDSGRLVGILTRADLVRSLYRSFQPTVDKDAGSGFLWMENVAALMEESFPEATLSLLRRIGQKAEAMGMRAYLVGGTVRDVLLGAKNMDIDVAVEGDAEALVSAWDEPGCRSTVHGRYDTGTITFPDGQKVDVATARREFYEYAAAQPVVSRDSLKQDLSRRDFTVNAMSISLSEGDWGTLTDYYGGRADLRDGVLKILHNLSFVEDPSRILRGVRLEQRLGMRFEDNTMRLLKSAVKGGLLECLSAQRVRTELEHDVHETAFPKIVARMEELGAWEASFPGMKIDPRTPQRLRMARHILSWARRAGVEGKSIDWVLGMGIVLSGAPAKTRGAIMDRLALTPGERKEMTQCFEQWPGVERMLGGKKPPTPSEVYTMLKPYGIAPLMYWATLLPPSGRRLIARHVLEWTPLRALLTGHDLQELGLSGPAVGEMLTRLRLARMDGEVEGREDELAFVERERKD